MLLELLGLWPRIEKLSPRDAYEGAERGEVVIVDVRTPGEWANTGCPRSSHRITLKDAKLIDSVRGLLAQKPEAIVALSCLSGHRAKSAARKLKKSGVENLRIVEGGIIGWRKSGLPMDS